MNRPAVRNVRALRIERELTRARQAHGEARERRRVAASHRAAVACTLVGIMLGLVVVCVLTALPWLSIAVPGALLMVSMGAGRRAARASAELDRNERRRIADLENELTDLTGERSVAAKPVWPIKPKDLREAEPEEAESTAAEVAAKPAAAKSAAAARADERLVERESAGADRETPVVGRTSSKRRSASAAPAAEAARSASVSRTRTSAGDTEAYAEARAETPADRARMDRSGAAVRPVAQPSARAVDEERPEEHKTLSAVAGSSDSSGSVDSSPVVDREAAESAETVAERPAAVSDISEGAAAQRALMAVAWPVSEVEGEDDAATRRAPLSASAGLGRNGASTRKPAASAGAAGSAASEEAAPATPPQGWRPVHVPAPTYTLAARAPRRALEDLEETSFPSAPVPERPTSVRRLPTEGVENEEIEFHPIDLDAVLEKRRAAGA